MNDSHTVISLFSGAGGFSYGFSMAGIRPICGIEINKDACASYELNLESPCHSLDLSITHPSDIKKISGKKNVFAIIGGPPCQGFSMAGLRNTNDERNQLIFNYLSVVRELSPKWFIFENVEGLLTSRKGDDIEKLVEGFIKLGYCIRLEKINFASYGIPQTRKRVIIIGNNIGAYFKFPDELYSYNSGKFKKYSHLPMAPTLSNAIAGLGNPGSDKKCFINYISSSAENTYDALMRDGNKKRYVTQHFTIIDQYEKNMFEMLKPGESMKDLPEVFWHESFRRRANRRVLDGVASEKRGGAPHGIKRLHGDFQALTITGSATREFIHPQEHRPLTIRECARIQSFPDCWQWIGSSASIIQQIGNAVPPLASYLLAEHIKK